MSNSYTLNFCSSGMRLLWIVLLFISLVVDSRAFPTENEPASFLTAGFSNDEIAQGDSFADSREKGGANFFNEPFEFANKGEIVWSQIESSIPYRINEAQAVVVGSKMYVFGGFDYVKPCCTPTERAFVFDSKDKSWTRIADMPPMNDTGHGGVTHAGFTTDGTDIYFAGGYTSDNAGTKQIFGTAEVWKYEISSNTYSRLPDLPMAVAAGGLQYVKGRLHWIGGTNQPRTEDLGDHYVLDLNDVEKGWSTLAPLPNPRNHLSSAVHGSKIYIFGGHHGHRRDLVTQDDVHGYDPATDQWKQLADLPLPLSHMAGSTFSLGDHIFIIGGHNASLKDEKQAIGYNPKTNDWTQFTDPPTANVSVAGVIDNVIYYVTDGGVTYKGTVVGGNQDCTPSGTWLEAECADTVGTVWKQNTDREASAGSYLSVPVGTNNIEQAGEARGALLSYQFSVDASADYTIYGRALAPEGSRNSFWIKVDDEAWQEWSVTLADTMSWSQAGTYLLNSGRHRLSISYREGGTGLDKILITADDCAPAGMGKNTTDSCVVEDNQAPVARAGEDITLYVDNDSTAVATLDASSSEDADGEIIRYSWSQETGLVADTSVITPKLPVGVHTFLLTVEDERGATAVDTVVVTIMEQEVAAQPPTADAGADTTIFAEADSIIVTLDGSASTDPDGELTAYTWMIANDTIAEGVQPQVSLPIGIHKIVLEVTDDQGLKDSSAVVVTIEEKPVPEIVHAEWLEGECADTLGSHWIVTSDTEASNSSYLSFEGNRMYSQDDASFSRADIATYHFSVDQNDVYYIFAHARSSDSENNQLWIQFDDGEWIPWNMRMLKAAFSWQLLPDAVALNSDKVYTLRIAAQGKLGLDKLYISSKDSMDGVEDMAVGCENEPVTVVVGLENEPAARDIAVYPNPGRGIYTVALPDGTVSFKGQMNISSVGGKVIRRLPVIVNATGHVILDLSGVASGIYLLQIRIGDEIWVRRIEKL